LKYASPLVPIKIRTHICIIEQWDITYQSQKLKLNNCFKFCDFIHPFEHGRLGKMSTTRKLKVPHFFHII
jgi:hypothetical protein